MLKVVSIGILLSTIIVGESFAYSIPTPTLELLSPKGFRISIPDEDGIVLFAFHGSINEQLKGNAIGDYTAEVRSPVNGLWQYENRRTFIDPGDTLYYWIHVQYRNQVYLLLDKSVTIPLDPNLSKPVTRRPLVETTSKRPFIETTSKRPSSFTTANPETFIDFRQPSPTRMTTVPDVIFDDNKYVPDGYTNRNCILSQTVVSTRNVCRGSLIFEDNFDHLNWNSWQRDIKIPMDTFDADFVSFQGRPENSYVSNGKLYIVPNLLSDISGFDEYKIRSGLLNLGQYCTGNNIEQECRRQASGFRILPPVVSAKINTRDSFTFRYGRIEVRAKLTKGDWLFPLITLEPASNYYGSENYQSGQMRVAYIRGNEYLDNKNGNQIDGHRLSGGVVLIQGENQRDIWLKSSLRRDHLGNDFHNYSMVWTDESITLSVDGNDYATIRGRFSQKASNIGHAQIWDKGGTMAPFDKEFYISLGVSAGGVADFPDGCRTGSNRQVKPWSNTDPKAELKFWNDRGNWHPTWNGSDAGLQVDYIRIYAL